ncbi:MAG: hypothetical protein CL908_18945 [Deltaproteobacteria bacterium]|nr:hypothetical protein [Deltaproteobacteria bacterium]
MPHGSSDDCRSHRSRPRRARDPRLRKEKVLHTRVSDDLAADIRKFAEELRVPASNLIRNVLEEVFTVVDSVSDDVGELFDDLLDEAEGVRDRVRDQAASRRRRRPHHGFQRRRSGRFDEDDVEAELCRDEAAEAAHASTDAAEGAADPVDPDTRDTSDARAAARPRAAELFPDVLGWQPLVLNRDFECGRCSRALSAGDSAFLGLREQGLSQIALCGRCAGSR